MATKWWEKTVEYLFVAEATRSEKLSFLAPLDGAEERASDAIFSSDNRWLLIEFKRDLNSINDERKKFVRFADAKAALSSRSAHHHLIFGHIHDNQTSTLALDTATYFGGKATPLDLKAFLCSGVEITEFREYITTFTSFKRSAKGSDGGVVWDSLAAVVGVSSSSGQITRCMSLDNFALEHNLELNIKRHIEQEREFSKGLSL